MDDTALDAFTVLKLLSLELSEQNDMMLSCISGKYGLGRRITHAEINRPGLALNGFFDEFAAGRLQIFGRGEQAFLRSIVNSDKWINVRKILAAEIPCCIFTNNQKPPQDFLVDADDHKCPVLMTPLSSSEFSVRALRILTEIFAPSKTMHGEMMEVYGIGILLTGESGVGKSETALELIERGHRLVADDSVKIRRVGGNLLIASASNNFLGHYLEVRGLGIISVPSLFGIGAVKQEKKVSLIVHIEMFDSDKEYERLGINEEMIDILDVKVPMVRLPIKPGRNLAILIETAAINYHLKTYGYNSASIFNQSLQKWQESEKARNTYFNNRSTGLSK